LYPFKANLIEVDKPATPLPITIAFFICLLLIQKYQTK
jgi:hypothetical protein